MKARSIYECNVAPSRRSSILESILLDTMFDLPSMDGVDEVMIDKDVVGGTKEPVRVYSKKEAVGDAA